MSRIQNKNINKIFALFYNDTHENFYWHIYELENHKNIKNNCILQLITGNNWQKFLITELDEIFNFVEEGNSFQCNLTSSSVMKTIIVVYQKYKKVASSEV